MGATELQLIADILGNMGDVSITGLVWFLSFSILKMLITAAVILIIVYTLYRVASRMIATNKYETEVRGLAKALDVDIYSSNSVSSDELQRMHDGIRDFAVTEGKYIESKEKVKDCYGAIGNLQDQLDASERMLIKERRVIEELQSIVDAQNKEILKGEQNGKGEEQSDTGAHTVRDTDGAKREGREGGPGIFGALPESEEIL